MDRHLEELKAELTPQSSCESENKTIPRSGVIKTSMEEKNRRLNQAMFERGQVEDGFERRRLEEQQFYETIRLEKQQFSNRMREETQKAIARREKLNREIVEAREALLEDGEGITFELLPDDILYRIFSLLSIEDRMKTRFVSRRMADMERKAGPAAQLKPFRSLAVTVGETNWLSLRLKQEYTYLDTSSDSSYDEEEDEIPFEVPFDSALNILRIMGNTITISEEITIYKFCHLSESDRVLLLDAGSRINDANSIFLGCGKYPDYLCDSKKNAGPLPFSLLRPLIEREWRTVVECPVKATVEDLNFIHEKVMRTGRYVFLRVIGDVGEGYRKNLKEAAEPTDKVLSGINKDQAFLRPELMRIRLCPYPVNDEKVVNVEDEDDLYDTDDDFDEDDEWDETDDDDDDEDSEDSDDETNDGNLKENQMIASVIQNIVKNGEVPTFDVFFKRTSRRDVKYHTNELVEINLNV